MPSRSETEYASSTGMETTIDPATPQTFPKNPGALRYLATCPSSLAVRMLVSTTKIEVKMDTREVITIPCSLISLADFLKDTKADFSFVVHFASYKEQALHADRELWKKFLENAAYVTCSGCWTIDNLEWFVPCVTSTAALSICRLKFDRVGRLRSIADDIPPSVTEFLYVSSVL